MEYKIDKRRLPKNKNDINNIRCIVLAVLKHFKVNASLLEVSENRYESYIDALIEAKIILREKNSISYDVENFFIFDENKIEEYTKPAFYKFIEKRIVPLFSGISQIKNLIKK